jgi:hypothetical protein
MKVLPVTAKFKPMQPRTTLTSHTTAEEKKFLNKIGTYGDNINLPRGRYIEMYMQTIDKRSNWGSINKHDVIEHCQYLLNKEKK